MLHFHIDHSQLVHLHGKLSSKRLQDLRPRLASFQDDQLQLLEIQLLTFSNHGLCSCMKPNPFHLQLGDEIRCKFDDRKENAPDYK